MYSRTRFTYPIGYKMSVDFWRLESSKNLRLKIRVFFFTDSLWSVSAPTLGLKTIPDVLITNITHKSGHKHTPYHMWVHGILYAMNITPTRSKNYASLCRKGIFISLDFNVEVIAKAVAVLSSTSRVEKRVVIVTLRCVTLNFIALHYVALL